MLRLRSEVSTQVKAGTRKKMATGHATRGREKCISIYQFLLKQRGRGRGGSRSEIRARLRSADPNLNRLSQVCWSRMPKPTHVTNGSSTPPPPLHTSLILPVSHSLYCVSFLGAVRSPDHAFNTCTVNKDSDSA